MFIRVHLAMPVSDATQPNRSRQGLACNETNASARKAISRSGSYQNQKASRFEHSASNEQGYRSHFTKIRTIAGHRGGLPHGRALTARHHLADDELFAAGHGVNGWPDPLRSPESAGDDPARNRRA